MEDQFTEEDQVSQQIIQNLIQIVENNKQIIADLENDLVLYDVKLDELANIPIIQEKFFQQTQSYENNQKDLLDQPQKQQLQRNNHQIKLKPIQTKKIQKQVPFIQSRQHNQKPLLSANQRNIRKCDNEQQKVEKKSKLLEFNEQEILQQQLIEEVMEQQKNEKLKIQDQPDIDVQGEKIDEEQEQYNQDLQEQLKIYNLHQKERQDKIANKIKSNKILQNNVNARQTINCRKCNHEFHNLKALKRHFCD